MIICGDVGDPNFENTWDEVIQTCKGFTRRVSTKPSLTADYSIIYTLYSILSRGATRRKMRMYAYKDHVSNDGVTNSQDCGGGMKLLSTFVFRSLILINIRML